MSVINVVLTMVRKLHSIALMLNLPLLHTGQMVLHWKAKQGRREELTMEEGRRDKDRERHSMERMREKEGLNNIHKGSIMGNRGF